MSIFEAKPQRYCFSSYFTKRKEKISQLFGNAPKIYYLCSLQCILNTEDTINTVFPIDILTRTAHAVRVKIPILHYINCITV